MIMIDHQLRIDPEHQSWEDSSLDSEWDISYEALMIRLDDGKRLYWLAVRPEDCTLISN
jgi:hypothetical protein